MPNDEFKREERYIVFKVKDALAHLSTCQLDRLQEIGETVATGRSADGKPPLNVVVVESDWPEFEPTWAAIEARMTGRAIEAEVLQAQEPLMLENFLSEFARACVFGSTEQRIAAADAIRSLCTAPQPPAPCPRCESIPFNLEATELYELRKDNKYLQATIAQHEIDFALEHDDKVALQTKVAEQSAEIERLKVCVEDEREVRQRVERGAVSGREQQAERIAELEVEVECEERRFGDAHEMIAKQAALIEKCRVGFLKMKHKKNDARLLDIIADAHLAAIAAPDQPVDHHHKSPDTNGSGEKSGDLSTTVDVQKVGAA